MMGKLIDKLIGFITYDFTSFKRPMTDAESAKFYETCDKIIARCKFLKTDRCRILHFFSSYNQPQIEEVIDDLEQLTFIDFLIPSVATRFHPASLFSDKIYSTFSRRRPLIFPESIFNKSNDQFEEFTVRKLVRSILNTTESFDGSFDDRIINTEIWVKFIIDREGEK
jgi:hypothetical protein